MKIYINLGIAYLKQGFFNIRQPYQHLIAGDNEEINIQLGSNGETIKGKINRTANRNGTPRIMAGMTYTTWVNKSYELNDQMRVEIISPNSLVLLTKSGI